MQIHGLSNVHGAQALNGPHATRPSGGAATSGTFSTSDELQISDAAARLSETSDIRAAKVAQIRAAIADGTYETSEKLGKALDRMLDEFGS